MIELLLLLIGARVIRRKWWVVATAGLLWLTLGLFLFVNAFLEDFRIPPSYFAIPLLIDAAFSLISAIHGRRTGRALRFVKAGLFVGLVLLIIDAPWHSDMIVGFLVGAFLVVDSIWRAASAFVVRHAKWRLSLAGAVVEFLLGIWSFLPWPSQWRGEVGSDVGTLLMVSGVGVLTLALRIRHLPPDMSISTVLTRGWPTVPDEEPRAKAAASEESGAPPVPETVTVHVWTPTGGLVPVSHGVQRYVAALDENGVISTGHAALELPPDLYVSHYPAVEISRSQSEFAHTLRATRDNDVPGLFQPSYQEESAGWCASTRQVPLTGLHTPAMRRFWAAYRRDTTYNLTNRNCSSTVAKVLDAGLEGIFAVEARSPYFLLRLLLTPELWVAGVMRRRAAAMAWTPGIVLDYARALSLIVALPQRIRPKAYRSAEQVR